MDDDTKVKIQKIDQVSPSFCLAKWLQCTIDLHNGTTHSCHHPDRHHIPLDELSSNVSALHNTQFKKEQRKKMLEGTRPSECEYCWKIEDLKKDHLSDRFIKSMDPWAWPHLEEIKKMPWDQNVAPTYLEIMFDNICNLSCCYCMADVSSSIENEMKKFGPYKVSDPGHRMPRNHEKSNKYVEAFWKWLPEIYQSLEYLRVTGGEPLLSPNVDQLFDYIKDQEKNQKLVLALNTNLMLTEKNLTQKISLLNSLKEEEKVRGVEIYTSLEAKGLAAEFIRPNLSFETFYQNLIKVCEELKADKIVIMATFNILSLTSFKDFASDILQLKKKYKNVILDISYLKDPSYLRANSIQAEMYVYVSDIIEFLRGAPNSNKDIYDGFTKYELDKFVRVADWIMSPVEDEVGKEKITEQRADFFHFITDYEKRKNFSFEKSFPEFKNFMGLCKKSSLFLGR